MSNADIIYNEFKKVWINKYKTKAPSKLEFTSTIDKCNKLIIDYMMSGFDIELPFFMGKLCIRHKNTKITDKNLSINWKETRKQKKIIRHFNFHTNGKVYKIFWIRKLNKYHKFFSKYNFIPARGLNRTIAEHIKKGRQWPEL